MNPIIDVDVKNAFNFPCAAKIPTSENGIAAVISNGVKKSLEPSHHYHVDQHQQRRERHSQVAKHLQVICHSPSHFIAFCDTSSTHR